MTEPDQPTGPESTQDHATYGPREFDDTVPNSARLYDYYLGGSHNLEVDRQLAAQIVARAPIVRDGSRANRAFLRRAVQFMVEQGVDQFLDLGSGVPTVGNVHEVAQAANPEARVVYVDYEPVAYHTALQLLADNPLATILHADLRAVDEVLHHPAVNELIDFRRPVGLLLVGVLLFVPDADRPADLIARYRAALPAGSYLALTHTSTDDAPSDVAAELRNVQASYRKATERFHLRSKAEIRSWFDGTELVPPGLVGFYDWRHPDPLTPEQRRGNSTGYVGVGRVR
jgi:hypothetical protein